MNQVYSAYRLTPESLAHDPEIVLAIARLIRSVQDRVYLTGLIECTGDLPPITEADSLKPDDLRFETVIVEGVLNGCGDEEIHGALSVLPRGEGAPRGTVRPYHKQSESYRRSLSISRSIVEQAQHGILSTRLGQERPVVIEGDSSATREPRSTPLPESP